MILFCSNFVTYQLASHETMEEVQLPSQDASAHSFACPLGLPAGKSQTLPSIRISNEEDQKIDRRIDKKRSYGGQGDQAHLGGFTEIDLSGISPASWKWMVQKLNIKSVLDVGCGRGISTAWFVMHGLDALCVEGSHDAYQNSLLPSPETQIVEHDFSRGPWWPEKTYDAVWCVEFLEHVGRNFHQNYLPAFRKAGLIFASHSVWGGWHHVEVHDHTWWIEKMSMYGFIYHHDFSMQVRQLARLEKKGNIPAPNGETYKPHHIWSTMQVFVNPSVTALPQHAHLLYEPGCYQGRENRQLVQRECESLENETALPSSFKPLNITSQQDEQWFERIKQKIKHNVV